LFKVDESEENENEVDDELLSSEDDMVTSSNNKQKPCLDLKSNLIRQYISHIPAQIGETKRIEVITKELFSNLFPNKFSQKKLTYS